MSIAATATMGSTVGPAVRSAAPPPPRTAEEVLPVTDETGVVEAPAARGGRRLAWALVVVIGCAFSYSIGWQNGWLTGTGEADARFNTLNQTLISTYQDNTRAETAQASDRAAGAVETAAANDDDAGTGTGRL